MEADPDYWKQKAMEYKAELERVQKDYDEYYEQSTSLEKEQDAMISQQERKIEDLSSNVTKLKDENDVLRDKLENQTKNDAKQHQEMSDELSSFKKEVEKLQLYVRQLEQKNDDLERAHRVALGSIEDYEMKYNQALERNGLLESELDEKEQLKALVQRWKDDARDLRSELNVVKSTDSNKNTISDLPLPVVAVPQSRPPSRVSISPLSIVNELLRKVGALENKLSTYNNSKSHNKNEDTTKSKHKKEMIKA